MAEKINLGKFFLCLNVRDVKRSLAFYRKLGLKHVGGTVEEGWAMLGYRNLCLGLYQGHIEGNLLNFRGGDVFAIARDLKARGFELKKEAEREADGSDGAWLEDPDGNLIYFNTHPDEREEAGGNDPARRVI
jgi:catechol 2,3-dioxygenase-like lactoylglutathione lyase family enzyme